MKRAGPFAKYEKGNRCAKKQQTNKQPDMQPPQTCSLIEYGSKNEFLPISDRHTMRVILDVHRVVGYLPKGELI